MHSTLKIVTQSFYLLILLAMSLNTQAQTVRLNNGKFVSARETTVERLSCSGISVQFARGVRWTPANFSPVVSINDRDSIQLEPGCYPEMSCGQYQGNPVVLIVSAPACGGNAVPEEYLVLNLRNKQLTTLNYSQAKQARLINY